MNKKILFCIIIVVIVFIIIGLVYKRDNNGKTTVTDDIKKIDYNDIENNLGNEINITPEYLMEYVLKKSSSWYKSEGYIRDIKYDGSKVIYHISKDKNSKEVLYAIGDKNKDVFEKKTYAYFAFNIDLETGNLKIIKISNEEINYDSATMYEYDELVSHIDKLLSSEFIISGYMATIDNKYYIYNSKKDYKSNSKNYFIINWDGKALYTGNGDATIKCRLNNLYSVKDCFYIGQ